MSAPLNHALTASDTEVLVILSDVSPDGGVVQIESEEIRFSNGSDTKLTGCTRGWNGTTAATHAQGKPVTLLQSNKNGAESVTDSYSGVASRQNISVDLTADAYVGKSSATAYIAPIMGNLFGDALSRTKNYLAGLIGAYSVTGSKGTTYPAGAVLGQITDGSTTADGAFVAYTDGDSALTTARAAFTVMNNNSTPGSGFQVGVDLQGASHDGYPAVSYSVAELRFSNGTKVTVSGDTIVFTNAAGTKSATITMA